MFNLLDRILATKSNMVELPTRLEKVMFNFYLLKSMYYLKYVAPKYYLVAHQST